MRLKNFKRSGGFTLVELIVSISITAILMIGLSTFFSSSFRNMFEAREKTSHLYAQFLTSSVLQEKLNKTTGLLSIDAAGAMFKNQLDHGALPFFYLGNHQEKLVLNDLFIFNGYEGEISSFKSVANIKNPAGITKMGDIFYVTAPLENAVYSCSNLPGLCEGKLAIDGLDYPVDIANDGTNLYLTDAGNDRVVRISNIGTTNDLTEVMTDLRFPTGLEYYSEDGGYLFVSDTYNHVVKRHDLKNQITQVVAGLGKDADCTQTALYCHLTLPTGLVIGNDGKQDALYIVDSGSGRILKVTDPQPDLSNVQFNFTLTDPTEIKSVRFTFADQVTVEGIQEGVGANTLHKGRYTTEAHKITYQLTAPTRSNIFMEECEGDPPQCKNYFQGFEVSSESAIFEVGDDIEMAGKNFTVLYVNPLPDGYAVGVQPDDLIINPPAPSLVQVNNLFSGPHQFFLDLADIKLPAGFNHVMVEVYNLKDEITNLKTDRRTLRMGDGMLGSFEDQIEVVDKGYAFPTGIGWSGDQPVFSENAEYSKEFSTFDYQTNFKIKNFSLSTLNNATLLELQFDALLSTDLEGGEKYETYTLSSSLKK